MSRLEQENASFKKKIEQKLKKVMDPELGVNIVDLGLVYGIAIKGSKVEVKMTLTFPGCPLAGHILNQAKQEIESIPGVKLAEVELVWNPPWTPERVKKEIKEELGL